MLISVFFFFFKLKSTRSIYFFFSSRRRHTRSKRDWSSDVCSSDLVQLVELAADRGDVVERVGTVGMARELRDLPGSEAGKDAHRQLPALGLQPPDLILDVEFGIRADVLELLDLRFELGDRLFEVEERDGHAC